MLLHWIIFLTVLGFVLILFDTKRFPRMSVLLFSASEYPVAQARMHGNVYSPCSISLYQAKYKNKMFFLWIANKRVGGPLFCYFRQFILFPNDCSISEIVNV